MLHFLNTAYLLWAVYVFCLPCNLGSCCFCIVFVFISIYLWLFIIIFLCPCAAARPFFPLGTDKAYLISAGQYKTVCGWTLAVGGNSLGEGWIIWVLFRVMAHHTACVCWGSPLSLSLLEVALLPGKWCILDSWPTCRSRAGSSAAAFLHQNSKTPAGQKQKWSESDTEWGQYTAVNSQKATRLIINRGVFVLSQISVRWSVDQQTMPVFRLDYQLSEAGYWILLYATQKQKKTNIKALTWILFYYLIVLISKR